MLLLLWIYFFRHPYIYQLACLLSQTLNKSLGVEAIRSPFCFPLAKFYVLLPSDVLFPPLPSLCFSLIYNFSLSLSAFLSFCFSLCPCRRHNVKWWRRRRDENQSLHFEERTTVREHLIAVMSLCQAQCMNPECTFWASLKEAKKLWIDGEKGGGCGEWKENQSKIKGKGGEDKDRGRHEVRGASDGGD